MPIAKIIYEWLCDQVSTAEWMGFDTLACNTSLSIEWTVRVNNPKLKQQTLQYYVWFRDDHAAVTIWDIPACSFPYCDPEFPSNLLEYMKRNHKPDAIAVIDEITCLNQHLLIG